MLEEVFSDGRDFMFPPGVVFMNQLKGDLRHCTLTWSTGLFIKVKYLFE